MEILFVFFGSIFLAIILILGVINTKLSLIYKKQSMKDSATQCMVCEKYNYYHILLPYHSKYDGLAVCPECLDKLIDTIKE